MTCAHCLDIAPACDCDFESGEHNPGCYFAKDARCEHEEFAFDLSEMAALKDDDV